MVSSVLVFDLEGTGFDEEEDRVTIAGALLESEGSFEVKQFANKKEGRLLEDCFDYLSKVDKEVDYLVTFFGKGWDVPFIKARAEVNEIVAEDVLPWLESESRHVDLQQKISTVKELERFSELKMSKNKLRGLLAIDEPVNISSEACALQGTLWRDGKKDDLTACLYHNYIDLLTTRSIFREFESLKWI